MLVKSKGFKGRQFTSEIILWAVRWYLMFPVSYRDLELMLQDRGVAVDHTTIFRWIQAYAAQLEKRLRPHLRLTNGSWRVDETYIKVKGRWTYLYRAVDKTGQTIDFLLSAKRARDEQLWRCSKLRQVKYLNNIIEQDHRRIKRLTRPGLRSGSSPTAQRTLARSEATAMIRKGQVTRIKGNDMKAQSEFLASLFQMAA